MAFPNSGQTASTDGVSVMRKGSTWPRAGINGTNVQTKKAPLNAKTGPERRLVGGGGMRVGSLRSAKGQPLHPKAARSALVTAVKG